MARRQTLVKPAEGKERFARLIDDACVRLKILLDDGQPDRRALSRRCGLSETTLYGAIGSNRRVSDVTLQKLAAFTNISIDEWRQSLGYPTNVDQGKNEGIDLLILDRVRQLVAEHGEEETIRLLDWLESSPLKKEHKSD